jgi:hypothetical protein
MLVHEDNKDFQLFTSISPFLKHTPRGESAEEIYTRIQRIIPTIVEKDWRIIERIANLFFNGKVEYIEKEIDKLRISPNFNISDFELPRSVKDLVATIPRSFNQFNNIYKVSIADIFLDISNQRAKDESNYISFLDSFNQNGMEQILKSTFEIINSFIKNYRLFLPIVYLEGNSEDLEEIKEFEGLTTVSIDELDKFYLFAYESLIECSELLIVIDNYINKGNHEIYPIIDIKNFPKLKGQSDFRKLTKGNRLKVLSHAHNKISSIISDYLKPSLRNAIGHNDYYYEQNTQKIQYNNSELYLIEFANICYQLIKISVYIWDIGFEFMKLKVEHNNLSKLN